MSPITNEKAHKIMGRAKAGLILEQPFFASLICGMPLIEDYSLNPPTLATNGKTVWYHPDFIEPLTLDEAKWCLCHEVGHAVFAHMFRRGDRKPVKWNIAGDYIINQMLEDEKVGKRVPNVLFDPQLVIAGGGTTDGVYNLLPDQDDDGSGSGQGQFDECRDAPGSEADKSLAEAEMKVKISQAAQAARMCGKISKTIEQFVDAALKPKIDWKDVLRRFVNARAKVEYTYARPKRRFLAEDLYLPSLGGQALGKILIAVDQSGSVSQEEVSMFKTEICAIHQDLKPEMLHVFYFDSEVAKTEAYGPDDEPDIRRYTCGGTAFSPIFRKEEELDVDPACCVVLTDLCCSDFGPAPGYPVLWITTAAVQAPWGQVVEMHPKGL